jgi:Uma2 family endonuclease
MPANPKLAPKDQMTIEEFLAFTETRPQEERWELIEGVPVMNPSPVRMHQRIAGNIESFLTAEKERLGARWMPMLGVGTVVPASPNSLPQPDVFVQESDVVDDSHVTDDALVLFEVLSKSNTRADRAWRHRVYSSIPNCQHYVTVSQKAVEVIACDRAGGWAERRLADLAAVLELPALGIALPLARIYRWTPLDAEK